MEFKLFNPFTTVTQHCVAEIFKLRKKHYSGDSMIILFYYYYSYSTIHFSNSEAFASELQENIEEVFAVFTSRVN